TMKLILVLLTVYCCAVVRTTEIRKLQEVLRQLSYVKDGLQLLILSEHCLTVDCLHFPPQQDCCGQSALRCFRAAMKVHFNVSEKRLSMLHKSLENPLTIKGVNFCNSGNSTKTCSACDSYPKAKPKAFFNKLESFIQLVRTLYYPHSSLLVRKLF
uniref:Interleukin 21 n=1 Tax=Cynoglossus semilaevis TaxID=244447 RepID=A0A3P8UYQ7_CYNSE